MTAANSCPPAIEEVVNVRLERTTVTQAAADLNDWAAGGESGHVHLVNAYTISLFETHPNYREMIAEARTNFPDGRPLVWLSRLRGGQLEQIRGVELFKQSLTQSGAEVRHFLLGGSEQTLSALSETIRNRFPNAQLCGTYSPPFRTPTEVDIDDQVMRIRSAGANLVWVGLGTPKQDFVAQKIAEAGYLAVAVGAAFDFLAGTKTEAPPAMSRLGLEWLYRLTKEPKRLWRRYLVGNARFLRAAFRSWVRV